MTKRVKEQDVSPWLIPCQLPQISPFNPIKIQTSILETQILEIKPSTSLNQVPPSVVEFVTTINEFYTDLKEIVLKLVFECLDKDKSAIGANNATLGVINNLPGSAIQKVTFTANENVLQSCSDLYCVRDYIDILTKELPSAAQTKLKTNVFSLDTADKTTVASSENTGWVERRKCILETAGGVEVTTLHKLNLDVSNGEYLFLPNMTYRIRVTFMDENFFFFNAKPTGGSVEAAHWKIKDASILLKTVAVVPEVMLQNEARLLKTDARYPFKKTEMRSFPIQSGTKYVSVPHAWLGALPSRLYLVLVEQTSFSGAFNSNPLSFVHKSITKATLYANHNCITIGPCNASTPTGYVDFYHAFLKVTGALESGRESMISYDMFCKGYFVIAWDLTSDQSSISRDHVSLALNGQLRIDLEFNSNLSTNLILVAYAIFDSVLTISKDRVVKIE